MSEKMASYYTPLCMQNIFRPGFASTIAWLAPNIAPYRGTVYRKKAYLCRLDKIQMERVR